MIRATIDQRARAGQRHLQRLMSQLAQGVIIVECVTRAQRQRPRHTRHLGLGLAATPCTLTEIDEIDIVQLRQKITKVRGPALLTITHDVNARALLIGQCQARGVIKRFFQFTAREPPFFGDAEPFRSEPTRLGHAADDGGGQ